MKSNEFDSRNAQNTSAKPAPFSLHSFFVGTEAAGLFLEEVHDRTMENDEGKKR